MAINDSTLKAGARRPYRFNKISIGAEGAGTFSSLWKVAGNPLAGSNPPAYTVGSGYIPTRATAGSIGQINAASGNELRMNGFYVRGTTSGSLILYDRLWACSGFVTNSTALQTVTTPGTLTAGRLRDTGDYGDIEMWLEVYTAPGATTATWTIHALDGAGVDRTYTYTHPANAESVSQMMSPIPPVGATDGFQQVVSFQASVSSGTAGDIGITLVRPIAEIDIALINVQSFRGGLDLSLAKVSDDAALAMMFQCTTTNTGVLFGGFGLSEVTP